MALASKVFSFNEGSWDSFAGLCDHLGNHRGSKVAGVDDPYDNEGTMLDLVSGLEQWAAVAPLLSLDDVGAVQTTAARINLNKIPVSLQARVQTAATKIADARKIAVSRAAEFSLRPNFITVVALSITAVNGSDTASFQVKPPGVGTYSNSTFSIIQITAHTVSPAVSLVSAMLDIKFNGTSVFQNEKGTNGSTLTGAPMEKFGLDAYHSQHRPLRPLSPDNNPIDSIAVTATSRVVAEYIICFDGVVSRPWGNGNCGMRAAPSVAMGGAAIIRA